MADIRKPLKEISLCLSGGGGRGFFHIGVLSYLEENGICIKAISGTSIGAIIGASYASGVKAEELLEIIAAKSFRNMVKLNFSFRSLFKLVLDPKVISKLLRVKTFEELTCPTYVTYISLEDGKLIYQKEGELLQGVLRSIAIPPAFEPLKDKQTQDSYMDGGVIDNLPIKPLLSYGYPIISVDLHPKLKFKNKGVFSIVKWIIFLAWHKNISNAKEISEIYITSEKLTKYSPFSFKNDEALFKLGYESAKEALQE